MADIKAYAASVGLPVHQVDLDAQFRCGGSLTCVDWVQRLLGLSPGGPIPWDGDEHFPVLVAEAPSAMEAALAAQLQVRVRGPARRRLLLEVERPRPDQTLVPT